ncbi:YceI family protein [Rhodohalobacter barkolensis]|uniref:Polyisoprenoid-binding protein n=1 Tax=Rhodohalobacter barkolensis TaxID=2053187 RepID=A0A2N0VG05_9BACT|nr:YceI family protein [Rhodohalobacter barkolensis]PKD43123.1 polyisoprenoid-binding protein [Rhodohalobacter barkolensis]
MFKKATYITLAAFLFTAFAAFTTIDREATSWQVDKAHSTIKFTINHFFTPVTGTFDDVDATINFDPENLAESSLDVSIPIESVNTRNERRDNHLKSEDFFNTSEWPNMEFVSSSIEQTGENQFVARGELTIRDVTREFDLPFELLGVMDHPMQENTRVAGIVANAELMRNDFGVGVGDWAATAVVGNKVDIELQLELNASN